MSDSEPLHPNAFQSSSNEEYSSQEEEDHQSGEGDDDSMSLGEDATPEEIQGDEATAKSGENGNTPKKERDTVVDSVTTPALEANKASAKKASAKKKSSDKKPSASGPKSPYNPKKNNSGRISYIEMTHEAIVNLKDRTGSSVPAIQKWLKAKYPTKLSANLKSSRPH
jgi:hypothetical protein